MWSHIWGWSHLAVQRVNQLVNSGSEWTIKTLEARERKVFPLSVLLTTMETNLLFQLSESSSVHVNSGKKPHKQPLIPKSLQTCAKYVQATMRELFIHRESGYNYLDTQTVYGDFAFRK